MIIAPFVVFSYWNLDFITFFCLELRKLEGPPDVGSTLLVVGSVQFFDLSKGEYDLYLRLIVSTFIVSDFSNIFVGEYLFIILILHTK